jgi:hypothetical protein
VNNNKYLKSKYQSKNTLKNFRDFSGLEMALDPDR